MRLPALANSIAELFLTLMAILHSLSHRSKSLRCLQVFDEQRCLTGHGYIGRVTRVAGRRKNVLDVKTE